MKFAEHADHPVLSALLWDVPALRALDTPGAASFLDVMGPGPHREIPDESDDPLALAAASVLSDRTGDLTGAREASLRLSKFGFWPNMLALSLAAFSELDTGLAPITEAQELLPQIPDSTIRAYLALKFATFAYDRQSANLFFELLEEAERESASDTRLGILIRLERSNQLGKLPPENAFGWLPRDELVELPWVRLRALGAAQDHLDEALRANARNPWSWSMTAGRTALDEVVAAERQATWAGRLWDRRPLRRQIGSQILSSAPGDSELAAYGLTMWVLGGGSTSDVQAVARSVEPVLDADAIDSILNAVANVPGPERWREHVLARLGRAFWDSMSHEMAEALMTRVTPVSFEEPVSDDQRRLVGVLGLRAPELLDRLIRKLDAEGRVLLVGTLAESTIENLATRSRRLLRDAVRKSLKQQPTDAAAWLTLATIDHSLGAETITPDELADAPALAVIDIAASEQGSISPMMLGAKSEELVRQFAAEAERSLEGTMGFGGRSLGEAIGAAVRLLLARHLPCKEALDTLVSIACNPRVASQLRLDALSGLAIASSQEPLPAEVMRRIRRAPMEVISGFPMNVTSDLLKAGRLLALSASLNRFERTEMLVLTRHEDARIRELVVTAAGRALKHGAPKRLEDVLVTALFDPAETVLTTALSCLAEIRLRDAALRNTVIERLGVLTTRSPRLVRAVGVEVAARWRKDQSDGRLDALLARTAADKSWLVRERVKALGE